MYLFVYEVSLRDRSYNRLRHRAFHGEAVPGDEKLNAKIPQLFVMNLFDSSREDAWLECAWVKRMVADIDRSELVSPHLVISPVLGAISPDRLSGGAKTLILIAHDERHVFNTSVCGDNCAPWLLRIGMEQDVLVRLGHLMHFVDEPFEIRIANTGEVVHTQKELVCAVIRHGLLDFTHLS